MGGLISSTHATTRPREEERGDFVCTFRVSIIGE